MFDNTKDKIYEGTLESSQVMNALLFDVCTSQKETICKLNVIICCIVVCFSMIICCMVCCFYKYESQYDTSETITTTTTMDTSGDNADINSVTNGNMYNDSAIHNEGVE